MNNIYFNTIAEAAEQLVMSKKQVRKLLDAGAFTDNKLTGKNRRVIFNQFGPVQPKEYIEFVKARKAFNEYLEARKNGR